eukprot:scaffold2984_cov452-Prasinococcus_capsulatus_cf.AAC.13
MTHGAERMRWSTLGARGLALARLAPTVPPVMAFTSAVGAPPHTMAISPKKSPRDRVAAGFGRPPEGPCRPGALPSCG